MKEYATDDDFLVKRPNGLLLSNNDVSMAKPTTQGGYLTLV